MMYGGFTMPKKQDKKKTVKKTEKKVKSEPKQKDVTEIVCIVDRSGSMETIKKDAIGGFNNFLKDQQKEPGKASMTIILFDHQYEVLCSGTPLAECKPFDDTTFVPRGSTALMDATGRAINEVNQRNPKKAIIVILTDGHENSSHEFTKQQIKQMIADCEKKGWVVIYLSADANAFDDGKSFGVGVNNIMSFTSDTRGANIGTMAASYASSDYRSSGSIGSMASYSARASSAYDKKHKFF
jgi:Mg-chelatase subunit ChlD